MKIKNKNNEIVKNKIKSTKPVGKINRSFALTFKLINICHTESGAKGC